MHPIYGNTDIMIQTMNKPRSIKNLVYLNFNVTTFKEDRIPCFNYFKDKSWVTVGCNIQSLDGRRIFLEEIRNHKFTICPRGKGVDTHRLWETLYMGSIPVLIKHEALMEFNDLPILFVDKWTNVTEEFLNKKYDEMQAMLWNMDKLKFSYWENLIRDSLNTFDTLIPIGQTCNITHLMENAMIKKQTTLFEYFVSPTLKNINDVLIKIIDNKDTDIIEARNTHVYIGDSIFSGHYNYHEYKSIYERRRNRLVNSIQSSKKILFCRFEAEPKGLSKDDIDLFIKLISTINPNLHEIKLLLFGPNIQSEHPSLIKVFYDKHKSDLKCEGKEINDLFVNTLRKLGYDCKKNDISFTDKSDF
jgi:hypothetical protein